MKIKVSIGEVIDKLTILDIKRKKIKDESKLINVKKEYDYLREAVEKKYRITTDNDFYRVLFTINSELWEIEDSIRDLERSQTFNDSFIQLARSVYFKNDERARIKKEINIKYNSDLIEEKSYSNYVN